MAAHKKQSDLGVRMIQSRENVERGKLIRFACNLYFCYLPYFVVYKVLEGRALASLEFLSQYLCCNILAAACHSVYFGSKLFGISLSA